MLADSTLAEAASLLDACRKKSIMLATAGLVLLAGCNQGGNAAKVPAKPKWPGAAYHLAVDTQAAKPNPSGVTIPAIKYSANPEALERKSRRLSRPGMRCV